MVITGDRTQIDLPRGMASGLWDAERLLTHIPKISFSYFTSKDVVSHPLVAEIIEAYEAALRRANAVDFGDLLMLPMALLRDHADYREEARRRFRWVLVDEFQDTNDVQMALVRLLVGPGTSLAVVGDDDQSIYRWRGARVQNILELPAVFPETKVVRLEQNYRSTGHILGAAHAVVAKNHARHDKKLWTAAGPGAPVRVIPTVDDRVEATVAARLAAEAVATDDAGGGLAPVAIFYRTHAQSMRLEEALRREGMAYRVYGGQRFFERKEVKDVLAYARLVLNPADDEAFLRVVNVPSRKIGAKTVAGAQAFAREHGCTLLEASRALGTAGGRAGKRLGKFAALVDELRRDLPGMEAVQAIEELLSRSGLQGALEREASEEARGRLENLSALVNAAWEHARAEADATLEGFVERLSLHAQVDELEGEIPKVVLMTLHNAKGLEFDHVIITGLEEGILPHVNSDGPEERAEERRLLYVGMTRARRSLALTYAQQRLRFGRVQMQMRSSFLADLPGEHCVFQGAGPSPASGMAPPRARPAGHWADGHIHERAAPADGGEERWTEPEPEAGDVLGRRVAHPKFGRGRIQRVIGRPGQDAPVEVVFEDGRVRKILARFLTPV